MTDTRNAIRRLSEYGQSIWLDNVSRKLISSGELQRLIDLGIKGLTSNPTIFEKALSNSSDYDESIVHHVGLGKSASEIFEELTIEDIGSVADALIPVYQATGRKDGFASLEVNPHLAHDTQGTVSEAVRLFSTLNRPNVMIKVPATPEGIPAISQLIGEGINPRTLVERVSKAMKFHVNDPRKYKILDEEQAGLEEKSKPEHTMEFNPRSKKYFKKRKCKSEDKEDEDKDAGGDSGIKQS